MMGLREAPRIIGVVDVGKTNAKVVLIDGVSGAELASRTARTEVRQDGLYPHLDAGQLWDFICGALEPYSRSLRSRGTEAVLSRVLARAEAFLPLLGAAYNR